MKKKYINNKYGEKMELKKAALINTLGRYSVIIIQIIVSAILSRILSPDDFGVIVVITVFSTFFSMIANMGFSTAIIQNKDLNKADIDNIYSFTVYLSFIIALFFAMSSFFIAYFYKDNIYIPITMLLSIALFFDALSMVPNGILNREKKFEVIAIRSFITYGCSAVIAIVLAVLGFKCYAIVIQTILASIGSFIWNYILTKPKFIAKFNIKSVKKIANYSGYQFASNFVNYFSNNLDNLLTGKLMGKAELAFYNKAYNLLLYPVNNLSGIIAPVLHPILADYQKNQRYIYEKYIHIIKLIALIGAFVQAVFIMASSEIINIMYGSQWSSSIICFHILSFCIIFRMINSVSGAVFQSLGNTKLLFQNGFINSVITVLLILFGVLVLKNIKGLAICVAIAYIIHYFTASTMLIKNGFNYSIISYYKDLFKEVIIFAIMMISANIHILENDNIFIGLSLKITFLSAVFSLLLFVTGEYKIILSLLRKSSK